jgi:putative IMPACT (imprinted ancient) family translation regulator
MRFTDDSEPQGTAGMPILDIIGRGELQTLRLSL